MSINQLYDFTIELYDEAGTIQEVIPQKVGFRRFEMKNGIMTLNGKRIVFKGVNRHEFSSITGRVPNRDEVIKDIVTMKKKHPCGSERFRLLRVGADFRLECLGCGHQMMMPRTKVTKACKKVERENL